MSLSGCQGGHQVSERDEIEDSPEIVGERGQAKFATNLLQTTHQKCALVHPLFDRAKRVFDRFATPIENTRHFASRACIRSRTASFSRRDTVRNWPLVHCERVLQSSHASLLV
jgi:hypothetical protein